MLAWALIMKKKNRSTPRHKISS